jgi:hypothetical protein
MLSNEAGKNTNKRRLILLFLLVLPACFGPANEMTVPVDAHDLLAAVKGGYQAAFRAPAGQSRTVFLTLRDRREFIGADEAADFPLGVKLETDDGFVVSFAMAQFPSTGPNRGKLVLFQGRDRNYVSLNSRFDRQLLSPKDRLITSGFWLNPLDRRWIYPLDGREYVLDEIRFGEEQGRFVLRRLFFGEVTMRRPSLFIRHFDKVTR